MGVTRAEAEEMIAIEQANKGGNNPRRCEIGRFVGYLTFRVENGRRVEKEFSEMGITLADKTAGWCQVALYERNKA